MTFGPAWRASVGKTGYVLAIVAPGQGAQSPGFLAAWLESPELAERLSSFSEVSGLDLARFGTEADAETIRDTAVAQPLLVAASLLAAQALFDDTAAVADVVAGHSVGELAAMAIAGVLTADDAMRLVSERGRAMAEASALRPTSMTAVISGDRDEVLAAIEAVGATAANNNGAGQIVAAGTAEQIAALQENPPAKARVIGLSVAGAFHTEHMERGRVRVAEAAAGMVSHDPSTTILSNADGAAVASGAEYVERLVSQVTSPVRWDLCMETMAALGVTGVLELPPAGTLTGIAKRNLAGVELFNLNTPDQLDDARAFCARHAGVRPTEEN